MATDECGGRQEPSDKTKQWWWDSIDEMKEQWWNSIDETKQWCYSSFNLSSIYAVKYHLTTHICLYQLSFPISMIPSPLYHFPALLDLPIILIHSSYHLMHTNYLTATVPSYSDHYSHALHQPYCTSHFNSFRVIPSGISLTREAVLYCGL